MVDQIKINQKTPCKCTQLNLDNIEFTQMQEFDFFGAQVKQISIIQKNENYDTVHIYNQIKCWKGSLFLYARICPALYFMFRNQKFIFIREADDFEPGNYFAAYKSPQQLMHDIFQQNEHQISFRQQDYKQMFYSAKRFFKNKQKAFHKKLDKKFAKQQCIICYDEKPIVSIVCPENKCLIKDACFDCLLKINYCYICKEFCSYALELKI